MSWPEKSCRFCGKAYYSACVCGGALRGHASADTDEVEQRINRLLSRDLSVPGRAEAALQRLGMP